MREAQGQLGRAAGKARIVVEYAEKREQGSRVDKPPARTSCSSINPERTAKRHVDGRPGFSCQLRRGQRFAGSQGTNRRGSPIRLRARSWLYRLPAQTI
jgi:hypothetical protein